jgi:hypothetical protein
LKEDEIRVEEPRTFCNILKTQSGQMEREKSYQSVDLEESKQLLEETKGNRRDTNTVYD